MDDRSFPFTMKRIRDLPPADPGQGRAEYHDAGKKGLTLRVTEKGIKTFYFLAWVHGKTKRDSIGRFPETSLDVARKRVDDLWGEIARGNDPVAEKRKSKAEPTFGELFAWYLEVHGRGKKDGGKKDEAQHRLYLTELSQRKAKEISRGDVYALHSKIAKSAGPVAANRVLAMVKSVFNVAIDREAFGIVSNPAARVKLTKETSRKRRLEAGELAAFFSAVEADEEEDVRDFLKILLYTGARKGNALSMRWSQINLARGAWLIPGEEFKNGEPHEIPLTAEVLAILDRRRKAIKGPWVFPGRDASNHLVEPKRGLARVLKRAGIDDFVFHSFRHTLATYMGEAGVPQDQVAFVLGHKPKSITGTYMHPTIDVLREAMERGIARMHQLAGSRSG